MMEPDQASLLPPDRAQSAAGPAVGASGLRLTAAGEREDRHAFLARSGLLLGSSLDSHATLRAAAQLAVSRLGDCCVVDRVEEGGRTRREAVAHARAERAGLLNVLLGPVEYAPGSPQQQVRDTGKPQVGELREPYPVWSDHEREAAVLAQLRPSFFVAVPLLARGRVLGVLTLYTTGAYQFSVEEFTTVMEFARRAGAALDNAQLYEQAREAQSAAEQAQEQFRRLVNGLRESEDKYRTLFEGSRDVIYISRRDGQLLDMNPAGVELFGYTRGELLRSNAQLLYRDPVDRERFRREIEAQGYVRDFAVTLLRRDGSEVHVQISSMVRRDERGEILGYQGIIHDVTEQKRSEERLQASEHFTRTIISSVQQGIIVFDASLQVQVWNRFMEDLTGVPAAEVLGRSIASALPVLSEHGITALLQRALAGETVQGADLQLELPRTEGKTWVAAVYSPHRDPSGAIMGVVAIVLDITERKRAEEQLQHDAFHDKLTGLPNRALFIDRLERLLAHTARHPEQVFGVAFLDLDRFKIVNDSLGHLMGDELLVVIAQRLQSCLRTQDTVARLGGDEFALLLEDVSEPGDATHVAERILAALDAPFRLGEQEVFTTASIGIALSSTGYEKPEDILRDADTAMYRAKLEGRSRYEVFDRNMHVMAVEALQIESELRRALERAELVLHYQPIVRLDDGGIAGFEALLRWQNPRCGLLQPADFIPLAEETGLIVPIGWWVLEEACRQGKTWQERLPGGESRTVSVNMSGAQFMQADLLERVDGALQRSGLAPQCLILEITESVVIQNAEVVLSSMQALRERGIQLCIDDFGTGYSSLNYLRSFPIDALKIDRSFIAQIGTVEGGSSGLIETIVALSRNLGMQAVAEGVETLEQLDLVRGMGPRFAQGFYFAAALPPAQLEALLAEHPSWAG
jgi:diguanylate cyclase (GGDEF)-like protein/PAS domain S-box-containing protein